MSTLLLRAVAVWLTGYVVEGIPDPVYYWSFDEHCSNECGICVNATIPREDPNYALTCVTGRLPEHGPYVDGVVGEALLLERQIDISGIVLSSADRCITQPGTTCTGLTVTMWLKLHGVDSREQSIFHSSTLEIDGAGVTASPDSMGVVIGVDDQRRLIMRAQDSVVFYEMISRDGIDLEDWVHVGLSWEINQHLKMYINGSLVTATLAPIKRDRSSDGEYNYLHLGNQWLNITVDELKIWSQQFVSENMTEIFHESNTPPTTTPAPTTTQYIEETTQPPTTTRRTTTARTTTTAAPGTTPPLYVTNSIPELQNVSEALHQNQITTKNKKYADSSELEKSSQKVVDTVNSLSSTIENERPDMGPMLVVSYISGVSETTSHIVKSEHALTWQDVPDKTDKLNTIIEASDEATNILIEAISVEDITDDVQIVTEYTFSLALVPKQSVEPIRIILDGNVTVDVPSNTITGLAEKEPVVLAANVIHGASACYSKIPPQDVVIYLDPPTTDEDDEMVMKFSAETPLQIVTEIVSVNIRPDLEDDSISLNFKHTETLTATMNYTLFCAYINKTTNKWTNEKCSITQTNETHSTVETFHLTNFAILMQVVPFEVPAEHLKNLSLITYIGSAISIFCLVLSLCIFALVNNIRGNRTERYHIHANLALAMLLGQVTFLVGADYLPKSDSCKATAILLHFFYMSAFTWMLVEGLHLYNLVVKVFRSANSRLGYYYMIGWGMAFVFSSCDVMGTSLLICVISVAAAFSGYGENKTCWLDVENTRVIWAFAGPACFIILVNLCILIKVTRIITNLAKSQDHCISCMTDKATIAICAKAVAVLMPILGVTWVFGVFAVNQQTIVFQYIFSVCNSLQGFFLFMFHCVFNTETRSSLKYRTKSIKSDLQSRSATHSRSRRQTKVELVKNAENVSDEGGPGETASTAFNTNNNTNTQYTPYGTPTPRRGSSGLARQSPRKNRHGFRQLHNKAPERPNTRPNSVNSGRFSTSSRKVDPSVSTAW